MKPVEFDYYAPSNVEQALNLLAELGYCTSPQYLQPCATHSAE